MTTGDEGDEHQMERRLQWEATAHKGQCNEQRGPKATLPEGCEGEATMIEGDPNAHVPSCPIHHVEKRSRHREGHLDGKGPN